MTAETSRWAVLARPFRSRNYRLFFAGQLVSLVGTWMQSVAQSWLVYRLTGSPLWLGTVTFCQQVPVFVLASLGGTIADRYARRRVLVATQTVAMTLAFTLAALTMRGLVAVAHVLVLAALLGLVNAVDIPTRQAFVADMVGRDNLMHAVAINSSMVNAARVIGPALAGLTISAVGEGWCFFGNGLSFLAVIGGLLAMRGLPGPPPGPHESALARILEGFRFVTREERIRALFLLFAITAVAGIPYSTLLPIFASKVFHGDARTLGVLMGSAGVGSVLGALVLASRRDVVGTYGWIAAACGIFGGAIVLLALSKTLWLSMAILVPLGGAMTIQVSATNTLVQTMTPGNLRGRVVAIWAMIFMGFAPFGSLLAGALASVAGPPVSLIVGGSVCMVAASGFARWLAKARPSSSAEHAPQPS